MSTIEIRKLTKQFGAFTAVRDADLKVDAGEVRLTVPAGSVRILEIK